MTRHAFIKERKKERKNITVLLNLSVSVANMLYLNLHLEVGLEVGQQSEEYGERQLKDLRHRGDSVFGQGHTQVLFDSVDEHFIRFENGPSILQDGQQQLERQHLWSQLVGPTAEEMQDSLFKNTFKNKAANFPSILTIRTANIQLNVSILTSTTRSGLNK